MKIVAINGSPKGDKSNTNIMVQAFLKGAANAGAKTLNIFLADNRIEHCKGCFSCWFDTRGKCIIKDDMEKILYLMQGADILVLATPLYFDNVSGLLKDFMDRLVVLGDPHMEKDLNGDTRHINSVSTKVPKLLLMSNCGFPERSHFQVISHWIDRVAIHVHSEVIGEIYTSQGTLLSSNVKELGPTLLNYFNFLEEAGKEIVNNLKISEKTIAGLSDNFIPNDIYREQANRSFDEMLK